MLPLIATGGLVLNPNNTSVNGQLPDPSGGTRMRVVNTGAAMAYMKFGVDNTVTADATGIPIPQGNALEMGRRKENTWVAFFSTGNVMIGVQTGSTGGV